MLEASGAGGEPPRYVGETAPPFGDPGVPENAGTPGRRAVTASPLYAGPIPLE